MDDQSASQPARSRRSVVRALIGVVILAIVAAGAYVVYRKNPSSHAYYLSTVRTASYDVSDHPSAFSLSQTVIQSNGIIMQSALTTFSVNKQGGAGTLLISPDGSTLYSFDRSEGSIAKISMTTGAIEKEVSLSNMTGVALSSDGSSLFVSVSTPASVQRLQTSDMSTTAVYPGSRNKDALPSDVAVSSDGSKVYVADPENDEITVVSTSSNQITGAISLDAPATSLAMSPDGSKLVAAGVYEADSKLNEYGDKISVITVSSGSVSTFTIDPPFGDPSYDSDIEALAWSHDGSSIYFANGASFMDLSSKNGGTYSSVDFTGNDDSASIAVSPDGSKVYLSHGQALKNEQNGSNAVTEFTTGSSGLTEAADVSGVGTAGPVAVSPDSATLYAQDSSSHAVAAFAAATNAAEPAYPDYPASGTASFQVTPVDSQTSVLWRSATPAVTVPANTGITFQYSTDGTAYVSDVTALSPSPTLYVKATFTSSDSTATPSFTGLSVGYSINSGTSTISVQFTGLIPKTPVTLTVASHGQLAALTTVSGSVPDPGTGLVSFSDAAIGQLDDAKSYDLFVKPQGYLSSQVVETGDIFTSQQAVPGSQLIVGDFNGNDTLDLTDILAMIMAYNKGSNLSAQAQLADTVFGRAPLFNDVDTLILNYNKHLKGALQ